jgi:4-amino-4-deoxy-L-arabinose transferase-like glycosyltransferase
MNSADTGEEHDKDAERQGTHGGNKALVSSLWGRIRPHLLVLILISLFLAKVLLVGFLNHIINLGEVIHTGSYPETPDLLLALGYQWDSRHFLTIAENGYPATPDDPLLYAFAPLYPMLVSIVGWLTNDIVLSGVLVSNIFYFASILSFYKVARLYFGYERACIASLLLGLFPTYLVYGTLAYSEAPFIFFATLSWFYFKKGSYPLSSIFITLAVFTRYIGMIILGIYFLIGFWRLLSREAAQVDLTSDIKAGLWFVVPVISTVALFSYFQYLTGDFLIALTAHGRFDDSLTTPVHQFFWFFNGFFVELNPWVDPWELALQRYIFTLPFLCLSLLTLRVDKETGFYSFLVMLLVLSLSGISAIASPRIMLASWLSILPLAKDRRLSIILVPLFLAVSLWVMLQFQTGFFA